MNFFIILNCFDVIILKYIYFNILKKIKNLMGFLINDFSDEKFQWTTTVHNILLQH